MIQAVVPRSCRNKKARRETDRDVFYPLEESLRVDTFLPWGLKQFSAANASRAESFEDAGS